MLKKLQNIRLNFKHFELFHEIPNGFNKCVYLHFKKDELKKYIYACMNLKLKPI